MANESSSAHMLIVAGIRMQREDVLGLASMLSRDGSDRTARVLLKAVIDSQDIVALSFDDRERILAVLDPPPASLRELRRVLFDEVNWRRKHPPRRQTELRPYAQRTGVARAHPD